MDIKTAIDELRSEVQANGTAVLSAATLIKGLADRISEANAQDDHPGDLIDALAAELHSQADALASAVAASGGQASTSTAPQTQSSGGTANGPGPDSVPQPETPPADSMG